jgi:hypothetical protein
MEQPETGRGMNSMMNRNTAYGRQTGATDVKQNMVRVRIVQIQDLNAR